MKRRTKPAGTLASVAGAIATVFAAAILSASIAGAAENRLPERPRSNTAVFAFPGSVCPDGSSAYTGPGARAAERNNAVYCTFSLRAIVLQDLGDGKCPAGASLYQDPSGAMPNKGDVWCTLPERPLKELVKPAGLPPAPPAPPPIPTLPKAVQ